MLPMYNINWVQGSLRWRRISNAQVAEQKLRPNKGELQTIKLMSLFHLALHAQILVFDKTKLSLRYWMQLVVMNKVCDKW